MRVLAAVVIPPHLSASGAVNAAMSLSQGLTRHCDIELAIMSHQQQIEKAGQLDVLRRKATNRLDCTTGWLPNRFRTLFYRSDIPSLVGNYDLVHIHNPLPALEMQRIARACTVQRVPYVITTHGFVEVLGLDTAYRLSRLESLAGQWLVSRPLNYVIQRAARICCLAPQDQTLLLQRGVPEHKLHVIPNGVDPRFFQPPDPESMQSCCRKWNLPIAKDPSLPICFFLANHTRNKGLDVLLQAFTLSDRPYCLIVGGKKRDFDYDRFVCRNPRFQRILFTDSLSQEEILALHHYSDLFVFPSRADTLPLVVLEAMATGRPVLSTKVGGIPYQVDATCGRLVEPNDPRALCNAFEELVSNHQQLRKMGDAAREQVRAKFDWERSARQTVEIYQQILSSPTSNDTRMAVTPSVHE